MKDIIIGSTITDGCRQFVVKTKIGTGGFAEVYRAEDEDSNSYAVKVLKNIDDRTIQSLRNEFNIASKVDSEHAIKYFYINEHGENEYPCFLIMEYADGGSLSAEYRRRCDNDQPYSSNELVEIFSQLIRGMIDISRVAVHRDIKLQNILLSRNISTSDGKIDAVIYKISDYGISKYAEEATRSDSKTWKGAGTGLYYAPELWREPLAHGLNEFKVDMYAMGIVFYQLANLYYPYDGNDFRSMHLFATTKPFSRHVDKTFASMISKMMAKSPKDRFESWDAVLEFLEHSSLGSGNKRNPMVDSILSSARAREDAEQNRKSKVQKEADEKAETFQLLASVIEDKIYRPLREFVDDFNRDSANTKMLLSEIVKDIDGESIEFEFMEKSLEDEERTISFSFEAIHSEKPKKPYSYYTHINGHEIDAFTQSMLGGVPNHPLEYRYHGKKILLWGTAEADSNAGFSFAILEEPGDMYGDLVIVEYTPNVNGYGYSFPVNREKLKNLAKKSFHEVDHTLNMTDYEFHKLIGLIRMNQLMEIDSVKDPLKKGRFDLLM